ncbi:hypothetical protein ACFZBC_28825 [Streptomyces luteogriseus]|uniref:hypothetical protein n=1 Tax=Streptomyces luteogriseus TaxID=68233 RepID=UPI0036E989B1
MIGTQHTLVIGQQLFQGDDGTSHITRLPLEEGEVAPGCEGFGVIGPQRTQHPLKQLLVSGNRSCRIPAFCSQ